LNLHSNTLEFLDETQKYIHLICHPSKSMMNKPSLTMVTPTSPKQIPLQSPRSYTEGTPKHKLPTKDTTSRQKTKLAPSRSQGDMKQSEDSMHLASSNKRRRGPLRMKNKQIQTFLERFNIPRVKKLVFEAKPGHQKQSSRSKLVSAMSSRRSYSRVDVSGLTING
jgi:hypothetical protein